MRKVLPVLSAAALFSFSASAQKLVLMPQIGTQTFYNDVSNFSYDQRYNKNSILSPTAGGRLMYFSRRGHGPYIGYYVGDMTVRSYDGQVRASSGVSLRRLEAGYQWITKPLYFKNTWNNGISKEAFEAMPKKGLAVQLQPSIGLFYTKTPTLGAGNYTIGSTTYSDFLYKPNFGINAGLGFAFSANNKQLFTLSANYSKGFGQLYSNSFSKGGGTSYLKSNGSGWHFSFGVPISLFGRK
jgi:hypothetical protein